MKIEVNVPDGISGVWEVKTVERPKPSQLEIVRAAFNQDGRIAPEGTYKVLKREGTLVMSNTPDEIRDFMHVVRGAYGTILINGLGLGVLVQALLDRGQVEEIIVIEKSADVIRLVGGHYEKDDRVTIIQADCFEYQPPQGKRYNYVWHDIWDNICSDNLPEMHKLHRKYGRKTDEQSSWCRGICEREKRQDDIHNGWY